MSELSEGPAYILDEQLLARLEQDLATLERVLDGLSELAGEQANEILATLDAVA